MPCPICQSPASRHRPAGVLGGLPVIAHALSATAAVARAIPRGVVALSFCPDCGHFFNRGFDPAALAYDASYDNSLEHSPRFRAYLDGLVERLVAAHRLVGRRLLEVGCGQGGFLRALCAAGGNEGVGFDPCHVERRHEALPRGGSLRLEPGLFSAACLEAPFDFIGCRHVLEHLADPVALLHEVRAALAPGGSLYFEVPNARWIVRDRSVWDLLYEHCGYFTEESLRTLFEREGFAVQAVEEAFGGQFLQLEATVQPDRRSTRSPAAPVSLVVAAERFGAAVQSSLERWNRRLLELQSAGQRVAIWGAGSKTVTFLNALRPEAAAVVEVVVDINPRKVGRFIAGSGHPIVGRESLAARGLTHLLLMNPLYEAEVTADCRRLGLEATVEGVSW